MILNNFSLRLELIRAVIFRLKIFFLFSKIFLEISATLIVEINFGFKGRVNMNKNKVSMNKIKKTSHFFANNFLKIQVLAPAHMRSKQKQENARFCARAFVRKQEFDCASNCPPLV